MKSIFIVRFRFKRTQFLIEFQCYMKLKIYMTLCLAVLVGCLYQGCGNDATKALFNFGFCFTVIIAFMYNPLMPVLLQCKFSSYYHLSINPNQNFPFSVPSEIALLRREHFNRWFKLAPYYWALLLGRLPIQIGLCVMYLTIIYPMSVNEFCFYSSWQQ